MNLYDNVIYIKLKAIYYRLLLSIFKNSGLNIVINGYKIRFHPTHYKWFPENYEQSSFEFIKSHLQQDSVCIDIGAHFGVYSLILAKYFNCHVYCFEPTPYSAQVLASNVTYNNLNDKIELFQKAVSAKAGQAAFLVQDTKGSVANSLVDYWHSDEHKNKLAVDVIALDDMFADDKVGFIKIDAEGAEYSVLMGGMQTIRRSKPMILLGLHPRAIIANGHSLKSIWDWIVSEGYTCFFENQKLTEDGFCGKTILFDVFLLHDMT